MIRYNRLVCALVVGLCVGLVYGAAVKIKTLAPIGAGVTANPDGDGMAIVNAHADNAGISITTQVMVTDLTPNTTYGVRADYCGGLGFSSPLAFTTNETGNGHFHFENAAGVCPVPEAPVEVVVYLFDPSDLASSCPFPPCDPDIGGVTADEARLCGRTDGGPCNLK
jgi:hypothetical protein